MNKTFSDIDLSVKIHDCIKIANSNNKNIVIMDRQNFIEKFKATTKEARETLGLDKSVHFFSTTDDDRFYNRVVCEIEKYSSLILVQYKLFHNVYALISFPMSIDKLKRALKLKIFA